MLNHSLNEKQRQLVEDNIGLANKFASKYFWHPHYTDIRAACKVGLCEAALRWDEELNIRFSTWSHYWILSQVSNELKVGRHVEIPIVDLLGKDDIDSIENEDTRVILTGLIDKLPLAQQHVIFLRFPLDSISQSYTDVEIARMLQISPTWVKALRESALQTLKRHLTRMRIF